MNLPDSMATALMSLIAAGAGAYFGSYFKKKGENLATREDIEAITTKQEEIKDLISNRAWDRQRQWEMKHDALLRAIQAAGDCREAIERVAGYREAARVKGQITDELLRKTKEHTEVMSAAVVACDQADILVRLLCKSGTVEVFTTLVKHLRQAARRLHQPDFTELEQDTIDHLQSLIDGALATARGELGVQIETLPPPAV